MTTRLTQSFPTLTLINNSFHASKFDCVCKLSVCLIFKRKSIPNHYIRASSYNWKVSYSKTTSSNSTLDYIATLLIPSYSPTSRIPKGSFLIFQAPFFQLTLYSISSPFFARVDSISCSWFSWIELCSEKFTCFFFCSPLLLLNVNLV